MLGPVRSRGGEVAARPCIVSMSAYKVQIVPLAEVHRVEHFDCVMYQLNLIDTWISAKVNCLEAARFLDCDKKLFNHVICQTCRLEV